MYKDLKREFGLFFLIPKNIYLPLSIFGIIFLIFIILNFDDQLSYVSSFIAAFITVFVISEAHLKMTIIQVTLSRKYAKAKVYHLIYLLNFL